MQPNAPLVKRFGFYAPIVKATETEEGDWVVEGPLSESGEDLQGERMDMAGLEKGLETFDKLGRDVDWEHLYNRTCNPKYLIGKGLQRFSAPHPKTGEMVPWLKSKLFKSKEIAREAVEHLRGGGTLGYSVEGGAIRKANQIMEPVITMVTLTPRPVVSTNLCARLVKGLETLRTTEDWSAVELPNVPDFISGLASDEDLLKAMSASGAMPHSGPGASAAAVEDVSDSGPGVCRYCDRPKSECKCEVVQKALAFQLASELDGLLLLGR